MAAINNFFQTLEGRTMMSAAPMAHRAAHQIDNAPAVHAKKAAVQKPVKKAVATIEPKLTDASLKYQSFLNAPLFSTKGPTANDINQGGLGDCYFLSTLSAMAKTDPAAVKKDVTANVNGSFTVHFKNGKKAADVTVDGMLPVDVNGNLAYAGLGTGGSVWVAVMEKAWAVYRNGSNSYVSVEGGWMTEAFNAFGIKSNSPVVKNSIVLLATIQTDLKLGEAVTLGTATKISAGTDLIGGHAYEVDSVVTDLLGKVTAVVVRNPWGIDGVGQDGNNNGYVTITGDQLFKACVGIVSAFV